MPCRCDGRRDQHDEGAGRPADLEPAAAERRDEEAADDRREQALVRRDARGDGDRHRQRQRDDGDGQPGNGVGLELREPVAFAQHGHELGREQFGEARRLVSGLGERFASMIRSGVSGGIVGKTVGGRRRDYSADRRFGRPLS